MASSKDIYSDDYEPMFDFPSIPTTSMADEFGFDELSRSIPTMGGDRALGAPAIDEYDDEFDLDIDISRSVPVMARSMEEEPEWSEAEALRRGYNLDNYYMVEGKKMYHMGSDFTSSTVSKADNSTPSWMPAFSPSSTQQAPQTPSAVSLRPKISTAFEAPMATDSYSFQYSCYYIAGHRNKSAVNAFDIATAVVNTLQAIESVISNWDAKRAEFTLHDNMDGDDMGTKCEIRRTNPKLSNSSCPFYVEYYRVSGDKWTHSTLAQKFISKLNEHLRVMNEDGVDFVARPSMLSTGSSDVDHIDNARVKMAVEQCSSMYTDCKLDGFRDLSCICRDLFEATPTSNSVAAKHVAIFEENKVIQNILFSSMEEECQLSAITLLRKLSDYHNMAAVIANSGVAGVLKSTFSEDVLYQREAVKLIVNLSKFSKCAGILKQMGLLNSLQRVSNDASSDTIVRNGAFEAVAALEVM